MDGDGVEMSQGEEWKNLGKPVKRSGSQAVLG